MACTIKMANNASRELLRKTMANFEGRNWANVVEEEEARMTPEERAARNARTANRSRSLAAAVTRNNRSWRPPRNNRRSTRRNNRPVRRNNTRSATAKPRPGKFMRECRNNPTGCVRHQTTHNCKFVHSDEPEFAMLRANQKVSKEGGRKTRRGSRRTSRK